MYFINVIFHIDESQKWGILLNNVRNLISAQADCGVEVLANGEAVRYYAEPNLDTIEVMQELTQKQVVFAACNNSLVGMRISKEKLFPFVKIVPAGVLELAVKQAEGYAYIKP